MFVKINNTHIPSISSFSFYCSIVLQILSKVIKDIIFMEQLNLYTYLKFDADIFMIINIYRMK